MTRFTPIGPHGLQAGKTYVTTEHELTDPLKRRHDGCFFTGLGVTSNKAWDKNGKFLDRDLARFDIIGEKVTSKKFVLEFFSDISLAPLNKVIVGWGNGGWRFMRRDDQGNWRNMMGRLKSPPKLWSEAPIEASNDALGDAI